MREIRGKNHALLKSKIHLTFEFYQKHGYNIVNNGKVLICVSRPEKEPKLNLFEQKLFKALDKGIDEMELGQTIPLIDSIKKIREKLKIYEI